MKMYTITIECKDRRTRESHDEVFVVKHDNPGFVARALMHEFEREDERNDERVTYKCTKIEEYEE